MTLIAAADDAGLAAAGRLLDRFNREYDDPSPGPEWLADRLRALIGAGRTDVLLAGDGPDGILVFRYLEGIWSDGDVAYVAEYYVVPERRRLGLGAALLAQAGYEVAPVAEGHLCCGSAGTYSLYQPELSGALKARKLANLAAARPQVIASDNFGCMQHLAGEASAPFVHAIELLDWASGGPKPAALGS